MRVLGSGDLESKNKDVRTEARCLRLLEEKILKILWLSFIKL